MNKSGQVGMPCTHLRRFLFTSGMICDAPEEQVSGRPREGMLSDFGDSFDDEESGIFRSFPPLDCEHICVRRLVARRQESGCQPMLLRDDPESEDALRMSSGG